MYGKLESGILRTAPKKVSYNGSIIFNPPENILRELGYLPIVYVEQPLDAPEGQHYEFHWEQTETEIRQVWELVDNLAEPKIEPTISDLEIAIKEAINSDN